MFVLCLSGLQNARDEFQTNVLVHDIVSNDFFPPRGRKTYSVGATSLKFRKAVTFVPILPTNARRDLFLVGVRVLSLETGPWLTGEFPEAMRISPGSNAWVTGKSECYSCRAVHFSEDMAPRLLKRHMLAAALPRRINRKHKPKS